MNAATLESAAPVEAAGTAETFTAQRAIRHTRSAARCPYSLDDLIRYVVGSNADERAADGLYVRFTRKPGIKVDRQWWYRHRKSGLTVYEADRLAAQLNEHPCMIWSSWFADAEEELGSVELNEAV